MKQRYIPSFIMLSAGAVTSIINIVNKVDKMTALKRLLLVIVCFYILGQIAKAIIKKAMEYKPKNEDIEESQENQEGEAKEGNPEENNN